MNPVASQPEPPASPSPGRRLNPRGVTFVLAIVMLVWGLVDVRRRGEVDLLNPGVHRTDFTVYTEAGAAFFDGRDPYAVSNPRGWKFLYPPLFAMVVAPLHVLDPTMQVLVWFGISVVLCWACYRECVRIAQAVSPGVMSSSWLGVIPPRLGLAAILAATLPALNCLQRGQVGVAMVYLLLLGYRLLIEGRTAKRWFLAGAVWALPIVLKITPLLPIGFVLYQQLLVACHRRSGSQAFTRLSACGMGTLCGLIACIFLIPAALVGWQVNLQHLARWSIVIRRAEGSMSNYSAGNSYSVRNQSLTNSAQHLKNLGSYWFNNGPNDEEFERLMDNGDPAASDPLLDWTIVALRLAIECLLLAVCCSIARLPTPSGEAAGFGLASVATLLLAPIARGHYYVVFLPGALFVSLWFFQQGKQRLATFLSASPVVLTTLHYVAMDFSGQIGLLGLGTMVWFVVASVSLLRCGNQAAAVELRLLALPSQDPPVVRRLAA